MKFLRMARTGLNPVLIFALLNLLIFTLSRLGLSLWQADHLSAAEFPGMLLSGLRVDIATLCALEALPAFLLCLCVFPGCARILIALIRVYLTLSLAFVVLNEAATPAFMNEFGVRPNHLYVAYLKYPGEVAETLLNGHLLSSLLSLLLIGLALLLGWRLSGSLLKDYRPLSMKRTLAAFLILCAVVPLGMRSTLGRRPLNPAMVTFSESLTANSLPLNSTYSAVYALLHLTPELTLNEMYAFTSVEEIKDALAGLSAGELDGSVPGCPLNRRVDPVWKGAPRNVVIVLEESLGAAYVGLLGGDALTPHLERLKQQGWWFERMYAAGNRSRRGIEAVTAGFPPSPLHATVVLEDTRQGVANLSNVFKAAGYHTAFLYGGEAHFDGMSTYFRGNGTAEVLEKKDFKNPVFTGPWGVSDEDLFKLAQSRLKAWHEAGQPFYALIFTTSFHDPYKIPKGRVRLEGESSSWPEEKMLGAKYADLALSEFLEAAKDEPWWQNTVVLVIADHESKVYANQSFPLQSFRIPALILGGAIAPRQDTRLSSQIDMAPTLLSLAGIGGSFPYPGQDLNRPDRKERALMALYNTFAFSDGQRVTVLNPGRAAVYFAGDGAELEMTAYDPALITTAAALENLGPYLYREKLTAMDCVRLDHPVTPPLLPAKSFVHNQAPQPK